jgi:hypothetical protein
MFASSIRDKILKRTDIYRMIYHVRRTTQFSEEYACIKVQSYGEEIW